MIQEAQLQLRGQGVSLVH